MLFETREAKQIKALEFRLKVVEGWMNKKQQEEKCKAGDHSWTARPSCCKGDPPYIICKHCGKGPEKK